MSAVAGPAPGASPPGGADDPIVQVRGLLTQFGSKIVHDHIEFDIQRGEVLAIVGGSGSGKSTLMREIVMLLEPAGGSIRVFGQEITQMGVIERLSLRRRMGVMFQYGALFGDLTVLENVGIPLHEHTELNARLIDEIALLKLSMAGLEPSVAALYPNELSGGMRKRAAMARAIALDPELIFLDEPSSGLDPIGAAALDELILQLRELLGLTIVTITHDMDSLQRVADRVVLLGRGNIAGLGTLQQLAASSDPTVKAFFSGPRGRMLRAEGGS